MRKTENWEKDKRKRLCQCLQAKRRVFVRLVVARGLDCRWTERALFFSRNLWLFFSCPTHSTACWMLSYPNFHVAIFLGTNISTYLHTLWYVHYPTAHIARTYVHTILSIDWISFYQVLLVTHSLFSTTLLRAPSRTSVTAGSTSLIYPIIVRHLWKTWFLIVATTRFFVVRWAMIMMSRHGVSRPSIFYSW